MALKRIFSTGTEVSPEYLTDVQSVIFDDQPTLVGHHARLVDSDFSDGASAIKARFNGFEGRLKVTKVSGTTVAYAAGTVRDFSGDPVTIAAGTITLPDNTADQFVFVNQVGVVTRSVVRPNRWVPMAKLSTSGGQIPGAIQDMRTSDSIAPRAEIIQLFGSQGEEGAFVAANNQVLSGEHWYSSFTVPAGVTLNVKSYTLLNVSGDVNIAGTVIGIVPDNGGASFGFGLRAMDYLGGRGAGLGGGHTHNTSSPEAYSYTTQASSSGGGGGFMRIYGPVNYNGNTAQARSGKGGSGGAAFQLFAAGTVTITGTMNFNGVNGADPVITDAPANSTVIIGGAGGGSGGLIEIRSTRSIVVSAAATILVKGGNGGAGYSWNVGPILGTTNTLVAGGGGGGGGYFVLVAPTVNTSGATTIISGGTRGSNVGQNSGIGSSSGGSFGGEGGVGSGISTGDGQTGQFVIRTLYPV